MKDHIKAYLVIARASAAMRNCFCIQFFYVFCQYAKPVLNARHLRLTGKYYSLEYYRKQGI